MTNSARDTVAPGAMTGGTASHPATAVNATSVSLRTLYHLRFSYRSHLAALRCSMT